MKNLINDKELYATEHFLLGEVIGSVIFFLFFTYDSEVRPTLDYPFLKELEFLCIKKLRIFA